MANLLFYENPVALNKVDHKDIKIQPMVNNYTFAAKTNSVILAGVEFTEAAKEYPIVFAQSGERVVPVALLGLRNKENLFVSEGGSWDAKYVPAFVRRYPFVLAETGEDGSQRVVCIDESFDGFSKKDGEPLFEGDEPTPILQQALDFLDEYQKQYMRTELFVKRLQENDLLMSLNAKIDMVDGAQFALTGLLAVDEKKLLALSDEKALEFFRSGELAWVYCHLMSIGSMGGMVQRIGKLTGADEPAKSPAKKPEAGRRSETVANFGV
ncbi:MAG: hypothetical protein CMQ19_01780 [Gammaproteobacteria bacterium]|jgi:hypothetical protein|nr:hypothetical protein [Gammaproteobacteria bacterium]|tara:strand:+ start:9082 stop:9885 length:804 start_codon:yes stop_codon:yes gene_type:complete